MGTTAYGDFLTTMGVGALIMFAFVMVLRTRKKFERSVNERILTALNRRRKDGDNFRRSNGYSWDYVMVFRVYGCEEAIDQYQRKYSLKMILGRLAKGGLTTRLFYTLKRDKVFVKIRAPLQRLLHEGSRTNMRVQMDEQKLETLCRVGRPGKWDPLDMPYPEHMKTEIQKKIPNATFTVETHLKPFEYMFAPLDENRKDLQKLYRIHERQIMPEDFARENLLGEEHKLKVRKEGLQQRLGLAAAGDGENDGTDPEQIGIEMPIAISDGARGDAEEIESVEGSPLRGADRLKLIKSIITTSAEGCCGLDVEGLLKDECIYAFFPLHDYVELMALQRDTMTVFQLPWLFPVDRMKDYFGEKIGLYFLFLTFYTYFCIPAGIVGFIFWTTYAADGNNSDSASTPYYAAFVGLWATLFLEFWEKKEKRAAMRWGMSGFEQEEQERPAFEGEKKPSPITGQYVRTFSDLERLKRTMKTTTIAFVLAWCIIAACCAIFVVQKIMYYFQDGTGTSLAPIIAAIWYAIQIEIFTFIFSATSINLTDYENHRTDTEYEDALIAKTFVFQFINCYTPLFYIAFLKPFIPTIDYCTNNGNCMTELQIFLGTIFLSRILLSNLLEVAIPAMKVHFNKSEQTAHVLKDVELSGGSSRTGRGGKLSAKEKNTAEAAGLLQKTINDEELRKELNTMGDVEKNYVLNDYNVMLGVFDDYAELVMQFGYTTMFVAAFPLCVLIAAFSNYVEIRVDAWKLCQLTRRPEPRGTEDIGTWFSILSFISVVAVVTNSAITVYTSTQLIDYTWAERSYFFIGITGLILTGKAIFSYIIYLVYITVWIDTDTVVDIQLRRQDYIEKKVVMNFKDDPEFTAKAAKVKPTYTISPTDDDPL
jgi:hypothetical protein